MKAIPRIGFGTYRLNEDGIKSGLVCALSCGTAISETKELKSESKIDYKKYVHIDTAFLYKNQKHIGSVIKKLKIPREDIWITSKVDKFSINGGKKDIDKCISKCLKDLGVHYIDLLLLHAPANTMADDLAAWKILEDYHLRGIIKHIGVSNYKEEHLRNILANSTIKPYTNQIEVSPFFTREKLVKFCKDNGIIVTAHSSLTKTEKFGDPILVEIATKYSVTQAQILLKWGLQKDYVIIPRSKNPDHVIENTKLDFVISDEDIEKLDQLNINYATHPQYL